MTEKTGILNYIRSLIKTEKVSEVKILDNTIPNKLDRQLESIVKSPLLSRDLSWLTFNERVLDQARRPELSIFEKLKFLAITASNLDEFFNVRIGSLYNYIDYGKERVDYSGLRERPFRIKLLSDINTFYEERNRLYRETLAPQFRENDFDIVEYDTLSKEQKKEADAFFDNDVFPMLTPMIYDQTHAFPILLAKNLILGVVTKNKKKFSKTGQDEAFRLSFVQIPNNLPKFYTFIEGDMLLFVPIERVIMANVQKLYRNIKIESVDLFRILRNADFTLEETDDMEADFVDEIKQKIKERKVGRLVSMVIENEPSEWMMEILKKKWEIDDYNIFVNKELIDFTRLWQIVNHPEFKDEMSANHQSIYPLNFDRLKLSAIFRTMREQDVLLHHPYNNFEPVLQLIERAAEDPQVMSIKLTIYRLAKNSRITKALLRAVENGKHVSALFEIKARFDEENNIKEAEKLQKAGCFVIYGIGGFKTHTKLMLIVRKEGDEVVRYAHMASGNYNEDTAKLYTDIGILTSNPVYTKDISEFFNVITGHSEPQDYQNLITSPRDMRKSVIELIRQETANAKAGKEAGVCIKVNSLEDKETIFELYEASKAGVKVELIVRGICCLRPGRVGLSENIRVKSIVGHYLEHARIFYFHNDGQPKVFGSSADIMVRSFDRRIESMFEILDDHLKKQMILILKYNLKDNVNSYVLNQSGEYHKVDAGGAEFNLHEEFFNVSQDALKGVTLDVFFCKNEAGKTAKENEQD
ncbi:polyphosphate kinase 1 [Marinilongibacter aquaticus]|uniref:polyphosphate kinase 1 n=1 Tax=Marinilongibacter aquaticus TaxID=2975157 RepID=UPI0021BDD97B|nr:polyphosphate kinase 1 [Marinilongibacter aquaticus]UBM57976.1 polyphosphate kinase 1 [Marinilongibacter aquaticus]